MAEDEETSDTPDFDLRILIAGLVYKDDAIRMSVTLLTHGALVGGHLVSPWAWAQALAEHVGSKGTGNLASSMSTVMETIAGDAPAGDRNFDPGAVTKAHLLDVKLWLGTDGPQEVGPMVVDLAQVGGWYLGTLQPR
ncbi:hypothetical protein [Saccharothrix sp. NRRL B-16314]|uniref:hypothetical protein n=1 Tax=Saccharothrix sp. NRRL B-16314 TaxID=1463825 RepID=UPI000527BB09|nr:hypothetical protein [Saccharothrix sp. NRRL B-16314]